MTPDILLQFLSVIGAIGSFLWGVYQWKDKVKRDLEQRHIEAKQIAETRKLEATRPFLDKQLTLYIETIQIVAKIATLEASEEREQVLKRFWELYWGELALVESPKVERAMREFAYAINNNPNSLQQKSLNLAHACRFSLDKSWGINAWTQSK